MKKIIIIGGGIIGLCSAYYLQESGCSVTVIDKSTGSSGASFVNAGLLTPSHFLPLASPGMIRKGMQWMLNPKSPFYVKPRLDIDFLKWSWLFYKSSTKQHVENSIGPLKNINLLSTELYKDLLRTQEMRFQLENKGLLMCFKTERAAQEEIELSKRAIEEGLNVQYLDKKQLQQLEPKANYNAAGALHYLCDSHMTPSNFMETLKRHLSVKGVVFETNQEIISLEKKAGNIHKIRSKNQAFEADEFILTAGSWSPYLTKHLGINIPVQAGKGYCINTTQETGITIPSILVEAKVAVSPMENFTRFSGTMEIAGINHHINPKRVQAIATAASDYYEGIALTDTEKNNATCGLRPVSPDGLPYIGKSSKIKNLTIATGHAMMGWSLGPATGKIVEEIILEKKLSMDILPFSPDRF